MTLSPKRRRRQAPRGWAKGLDDLHDYHSLELPKRRVRRPMIEDSGPVTIRDDWPDRVPITDAELRVIETFLSKELDELFGAAPCSPRSECLDEGLRPFPPALVERITALTEGIEADLNAPIDGEVDR